MEAKDIVIAECRRQAEFGYEPSWEDFVIAGQKAGIREVVECIKKYGVGYALSPKQLKEWGI